MTISSTVNKVALPTNGLTTIFPWTFLVPDLTTFAVYETDPAGNVALISPVSYTVTPGSFGNTAGGSIIYMPGGVPRASGYTITIYRVVPLRQLTALGIQGNYDPAQVEAALDYLMMGMQQVQENLGRTVTAPVGDPATQLTIPAAGTRANKFLAFDGNGNPVATTTAPTASGNADFVPSANATYSLGSSLLSWLNLWITGVIKFVSGSFKGSLSAPGLTADRTYQLPDASGTVALVSTTLTGTVLNLISGSFTGFLATVALTANRNYTLPDYDCTLNNLPAGAIVDFAMVTPPNGTLECDGSSYLRATYPNLFAAIGTTWGSVDGTHFNVPDFRGRTRIGRGTGLMFENFADTAVHTGTDTIDVGSNADKLVTGMSVVTTFNVGTITGAGISNGGTCYVIRTGATTIKLATTLANAQNGVAIDITAVTGGGSFTISHTLVARTLGLGGGEEQHAMSSSEILSHSHTFPNNVLQISAGGNQNGTAANALSPLSGTNATGGNAAMNVTQMYMAVLTCIYY